MIKKTEYAAPRINKIGLLHQKWRRRIESTTFGCIHFPSLSWVNNNNNITTKLITSSWLLVKFPFSYVQEKTIKCLWHNVLRDKHNRVMRCTVHPPAPAPFHIKTRASSSSVRWKGSENSLEFPLFNLIEQQRRVAVGESNGVNLSIKS